MPPKNFNELSRVSLRLSETRIFLGESIQCFVCNSRSDPRCADPIQTDWQGADDQDSDNPHDSSDGGLEPLECYLANRYSKGIQAVSDLVFRGFGHPRLGVPDLWATTAAVLSGPGGNRGPKGNRGSPWGYYGGQREDDEATGCHKVVYTGETSSARVNITGFLTKACVL